MTLFTGTRILKADILMVWVSKNSLLWWEEFQNEALDDGPGFARPKLLHTPEFPPGPSVDDHVND